MEDKGSKEDKLDLINDLKALTLTEMCICLGLCIIDIYIIHIKYGEAIAFSGLTISIVGYLILRHIQNKYKASTCSSVGRAADP